MTLPALLNDCLPFGILMSLIIAGDLELIIAKLIRQIGALLLLSKQWQFGYYKLLNNCWQFGFVLSLNAC
jgi:hypothetical protein